ncbi:MAG TPA: DPP IV N-terminal domain-containing protein [Gemmatimonadales bacterium]
MTRFAALAGLSLVIAACGDREPETPTVPESTLLVSDSLGQVVGAGILSPDGARLAFVRTVAGKAAIFVANPDGSHARQLTSGVWDNNPIWSPDGTWIAYQAESPQFDIMVVSADSGAPRQLTSGPATDTPRNWLPDGSAVIFGRTGEGDDQTLVVPLAGGPVRRLAAEVKGNQHANLAPDGVKIGYDVHVGGGEATVWVQDSAGAAPRQLTTENLENINAVYLWSPDSRYIAYQSVRTGTSDIWIVDVATGEQRQLTNDIRNDLTPRWSPDGKWMAFISDRGGQTDLWMMPVEGGNAIRLTNDRASEFNPRWTPDGMAITYGQTEIGSELVSLPPGGGEPRVVLALPGYNIPSGDVSPDGKTILYASDRSGNNDIWSVPVSGGDPVVFSASPALDDIPRYSPDGSQVLFRSARGGAIDLWLSPAAGGEPRQLTSDAANEGSHTWSPDGKSIAYSSNRGTSGGDLWVMDTIGAEPRRLTQTNIRPGGIWWGKDGNIYFNGAAVGGRQLFRIAASGGTPRGLGVRLPSIGYVALSFGESQLSYSSFEGGWAFLDVIPTSGGTPRRLTKPTEGVFHALAIWSPGDSILVATDIDYQGNHDATELYSVRVADGIWTRLTNTRLQSEYPLEFLPDGSQLLVGRVTNRVAIRSVRVTDPIPRSP